MRRKLIDADAIEFVLGLGPNLFYNSPMEACVVICRTAKPKARKSKILFINAVNEVTRERAQSFLTDDHIERIVNAYRGHPRPVGEGRGEGRGLWRDDPGFTRVATLEEIRAKDGKLSIPLYVGPAVANGGSDANPAKANQPDLPTALNGWLQSSTALRAAVGKLCAGAP
jgi:type I restriction enzyme M protein